MHMTWRSRRKRPTIAGDPIAIIQQKKFICCRFLWLCYRQKSQLPFHRVLPIFSFESTNWCLYQNRITSFMQRYFCGFTIRVSFIYKRYLGVSFLPRVLPMRRCYFNSLPDCVIQASIYPDFTLQIVPGARFGGICSRLARKIIKSNPEITNCCFVAPYFPLDFT